MHLNLVYISQCKFCCARTQIFKLCLVRVVAPTTYAIDVALKLILIDSTILLSQAIKYKDKIVFIFTTYTFTISVLYFHILDFHMNYVRYKMNLLDNSLL